MYTERTCFAGASIIIVADIMKSRLNLAKKMGANVVIDCTVQNLHDEIMTLTGGIGVSRLMECSGSQCNAAFSLLRKVQIIHVLIIE
jgi:threonine dehydrogenase-like Zn-dependent dehydrogenase